MCSESDRAGWGISAQVQQHDNAAAGWVDNAGQGASRGGTLAGDGEPLWSAGYGAGGRDAMGIASPSLSAAPGRRGGGALAITGVCLLLTLAAVLGGCASPTRSASAGHASDRLPADSRGAAAVADRQPGQTEQLERVVVVFRHGVRAPLQGEAAAAQYADQPWPQWSTPASLLTPRGRKAVRLSGAYLRQWLTQQTLLPHTGCPAAGSVSVWANTDQRTIDSGALLADALAPGCGIVAGHREAGSNDPLFRPIEAGAVPFDAAAAVASIQQQTGGPAAVLQGHAAELQAMQQILGCTRTPCDFARMPSTLAPSANGRGLALGGPIDLTSGTGEVLLLQYADGLPLSQVGWGRTTPERLAQVSRLHALLFDIYARPHYMAQRSGAPLAREVLQRFGDAQSPTLSVFVGSDTHIAALSSLLGVHFHLPGYGADDPPPGGALLLGLWRQPDGTRVVRARYLAQSLDQLRTLAPLDLAHPPLQQELALDVCAPEQRMACPLPAFAQALEQQLQLDP